MEKEHNFPDLIFSHDWYNFTYIVLNIIEPVFDLGRSMKMLGLKKVRKKPWKSLEMSKLRRSPGCYVGE